jgi:thymidine phosphorylase
VEHEGGCIVWGGAVRLSPADDVLIRIERALDIDSEGQLIASVLSKKIAAGSSHVVLDVPVGPTAKVRSLESAQKVSAGLARTAAAFGLATSVILSDGRQPVGRGIGPALEARDVLSVLQNRAEHPADLNRRACSLAGRLLELGGVCEQERGFDLAQQTLGDGRAWTKFQRICEAQGGMRRPTTAAHKHPILAGSDAVIAAIDNRKISRLAKLAGAPEAKAAGIELYVKLGQSVTKGEALYSVHAESRGELNYALEFAGANPDIAQLASA